MTAGVSLRAFPSEASVALLLIPHAGGGASSFNQWLEPLARVVAPMCVQLPGREDVASLPLMRDVAAVVEGLLPLIAQEVQAPLALYGHSMGALVAFELAYALENLVANPPLHVFVSGRRAAHLPSSVPTIHHLPDDELATALHVATGSGAAWYQSKSFRRYALPIIRADLEINEVYSYPPGRKVQCPITAFCGIDDPIAQPSEMRAWSHQTAATFTYRALPGDHIFHQTRRMDVIQHIIDTIAGENGQIAS
ncbi:thioesterase II family protein [Mycobacterium simulans]|uniref:thioesterase II family protein n=1 Tax=Mycobacterium simulans TaxID=627089 RepID=UPI00174BCDE3|nr:alpha/beta fold hydrolase [Mycobacterium simulans]